MALEMKRYVKSVALASRHEAKLISCSYECTFCSDCTAAMKSICPNCGGELVRRPRRKDKEL